MRLVLVFVFFLFSFLAAFAQQASYQQASAVQTDSLSTYSGSPKAVITGKNGTNRKSVESAVYICDSKTSYAYHSSTDCRGLSRCTHGVVKLTRKEADQSRTPCKWCY